MEGHQIVDINVALFRIMERRGHWSSKHFPLYRIVFKFKFPKNDPKTFPLNMTLYLVRNCFLTTLNIKLYYHLLAAYILGLLCKMLF